MSSRDVGRRIELNGSTFLFEFDSYELRAEARQALSMVAGHTDSIRSAEYNQRLSDTVHQRYRLW